MSSAAAARTSDDSAQRQRALDPGDSFIAQAPAGSGKTELLIQRFLRLLALVAEPESVVAITFTRKAAAEMQARIIEALRRADSGIIPEQPHERVSYELAERALAHDRDCGWNLIEHPSRLRIQTIDSLCASITRQMPWLARLGAQPEVAEDAEPLYLEAARRTVLEVEQDGAIREALECVLLHLDNNLPRVQELLAAMLARRDQWLALAVAADSDEARSVLESSLSSAVTDGLARADRLAPPEAKPEFLELAGYAASNLSKPVYSTWPGTVPGDHAQWKELAALVLTGSDEWRKRLDKNRGFPAPSGAKNPVEKLRFKEKKEACERLIARLSRANDLLEALQLVRKLPPPTYSDAQWRVMQSLACVLKVAVAHLKMVFREEATADFCEIAEAARSALGGDLFASELALGLDGRIQHLLVDEFQDTSVAQYELLERLTAGWSPGDGHTLFLVGDPMQSIYRFRQAEVALFLKVIGDGLGNVRPEYLRLIMNHRSSAGIVERVNELFSRIFPALSDPSSGAIAYSACTAANPGVEGEAVVVHAFAKGEDEVEAQLVADLVNDARQRGKVAVLVRARTHLPAIVAALKRANIPFSAVDIDRLNERAVVQDLLALTRAMLHLADRPSWLAILRVPWCGLTLADLYALVAGNDNAPVWDLLDGDLSRISEDGRARLLRVREILASAFAERGRWPLRRWIERTWQNLGGPACLQDDADLTDASDFLDLVERHESGGDLPEFDGFRREASELFAKPDPAADGTVQLMTIHKAKGLQFETVIVPGLGRTPRPDMPALLLSAERPRADGLVDRLLATIKETGTEQDDVYSYLRVLDQQKSEHEEVRLLYVAATRAKERLHLIGHAVANKDGEVRPKGGSLLSYLWDGLREEERQRFRDHAAAAGPPEARQAIAAPLRRLPAEWAPPALPDGVQWTGTPQETELEQRSYLWVGDTLRHIGTVVHAMLQRTGHDGAHPPEANGCRSALANLGVPPAELDDAVQKVERALNGTMNSARGRWILDPHPQAKCEYALTGVLDGRVVRGTVDRTFVDDAGTRWIVDYKTSAHEGGGLEQFLDEEQRRHRGQLERYARFFAAEGRPIRLGLYFPLLDGWREWAPPNMEDQQ